ncbi:CGNR zinc finger domain-containing protein [Actinomadura keratinilytica]
MPAGLPRHLARPPRRWCSGETCGNRERVARHRRSRKG